MLTFELTKEINFRIIWCWEIKQQLQTYRIDVPGQLKKQSNSLPSCNPHVHVITLEQPLQFRQVSAQHISNSYST